MILCSKYSNLDLAKVSSSSLASKKSTLGASPPGIGIPQRAWKHHEDIVSWNISTSLSCRTELHTKSASNPRVLRTTVFPPAFGPVSRRHWLLVPSLGETSQKRLHILSLLPLPNLELQTQVDNRPPGWLNLTNVKQLSYASKFHFGSPPTVAVPSSLHGAPGMDYEPSIELVPKVQQPLICENSPTHKPRSPWFPSLSDLDNSIIPNLRHLSEIIQGKSMVFDKAGIWLKIVWSKLMQSASKGPCLSFHVLPKE